MTCPKTNLDVKVRPWVKSWNDQHYPEWYVGWMQKKDVSCQLDEYPPAAFWQDMTPRKQYIRFLPGSDNEGAGSLFGLSFCGYVYEGQQSILPHDTTNERANGQLTSAGIVRDITEYEGVTTQGRLVLTFPGIVNPDGEWGLNQNPCWPAHLVHDPGFALLRDDKYYAAHKTPKTYGSCNYPDKIPLDVLDAAHADGYSSSSGYRKREDMHALDPEAWVINDGNSTRLLSSDELKNLGILKCASADCRAEMSALGIESAAIVQPTQAAFVQAKPSACITTTSDRIDEAAIATPSPGLPGYGQQPRATAM